MIKLYVMKYLFIKVSYNWKDRVWSFILQFGHVRWNAFTTYKVESSVKKCQFVKVQNKFGIAFFMDLNKPAYNVHQLQTYFLVAKFNSMFRNYSCRTFRVICITRIYNKDILVQINMLTCPPLPAAFHSLQHVQLKQI